eukprot:scaffold56691_cov89-Phaeocystis_antarctica.AAC.1
MLHGVADDDSRLGAFAIQAQLSPSRRTRCRLADRYTLPALEKTAARPEVSPYATVHNEAH